jgi:sugar phosphate isomerase/epimerase
MPAHPLGVTAVMLPELDFDEQIALCAKLGVRYYQYRPRDVAPADRTQPYSNWGNHKFHLTPARWRAEGAALTRRLRDAGLEPWGAVPHLTIDRPADEIRLAIDGAIAAGAGRVRCNPPGYPGDLFDYGDYLRRTLDLYQSVSEQISGPAGVKLILETHAGSSATSPGLARLIVQNFSPDRVGVIFDLPNFAREGEVREHLAVSALAPWIDCVHFGGARRYDAGRDDLGARKVRSDFCAPEESDLHLPTWLKLLQIAAPAAPWIVEDYESNVSGTDRLTRCVAFCRRVAGA